MMRRLVWGLALGVSTPLWADGLPVDRLYSPYVQPLEKELEYRYIQADGGLQAPEGLHVQKLGFGAAISERVALEAYVIAADTQFSDRIEALELEARWQLTEQGEYESDWGLQLEYEQDREGDERELAVSLLAQKDWTSWQGIANASLIHEKQKGLRSELETRLALQARYRYRAVLEPGVELFLGEDYRGIGPALYGTVKLAAGRSLRWELAAIAGLDRDSADHAMRLLLEYEFF